MAELYVNHNGANAKVKELYVNYNGSNTKVKELYESNGTSWVKIFNTGVTPTGAASWQVTAGHYKETYHFNPQVTYNNGLHISVPWTFDGGVSGDPAEAFLDISIPVAFNQTIDFTSMQPIWGLNTAFIGSQQYGWLKEVELYLNSTGNAGLTDAQPFTSNSSLAFSPMEVNAMRTVSLSSSYLVIELYFSGGGSSSHGDTFTMDIPNEAIYILAQGARIPFIFG